jgi:hypothetical protein
MTKRLVWLQTLVLAGGSVFAWTTVLRDVSRFTAAGGHLWRFRGCSVPNPLVTPCFYGAVLFVVALVWAISQLQAVVPERRAQRQLVGMLGAGTLFAWGNFGHELWRYWRSANGEFTSCSGTLAVHPIHTPCFTGAVLYLTALILAVLAARRIGRSPAPIQPAP